MKEVRIFIILLYFLVFSYFLFLFSPYAFVYSLCLFMLFINSLCMYTFPRLSSRVHVYAYVCVMFDHSVIEGITQDIRH